MIITLVNADFSGEGKNIGTLSTWIISRVLGDGATYNSDITYVDKNAPLNATVTIAEGYEIVSDGVTVTMGGSPVSAATVSEDGKTITIYIDSVTGNVVIKVPTKNTATGEEGGNEEPVEPTTTWYIQKASVSAPTELKASSNANGLSFYDADDNNALRNKPINTVRFLTTSTSGTVTIGVVDQVQGTTISDTRSASFTKGTTDKEIVTVTFDTPITLTDEQMLVFEPTDEGAKRGYNFYFTGASYDTGKTGKSFYTRVPKDASGAGKQWTYSDGGELNIDVGYIG